MFDPEKVERYQGIDVDGLNGSKGWGGGLRCVGDGDIDMVMASDFDQLLSDYKEAIAQIRTLIKERDALVPKAL